MTFVDDFCAFLRQRAAIALAFGVCACSTDSAEPAGDAASPDHATPAPPADAGPSPQVLACRQLFAKGLGLEAGLPHVSFRDDLMPLFGTHCTFGGCHDGRETTGQMRLGDPCVYDPRRATCELDGSSFTEEVATIIHGNLLRQANAAPNLKRVEPSRIDRSFLLMKLSGCQNAFPEITGCAKCGTVMPPVDPLRKSDPELFTLIATWVAQGAELD